MNMNTALKDDIWEVRRAPLPQDVVDTLFRFGAGGRMSRHRIAVFAVAMDDKDFCDFLKEEYGKASIGLVLDGKNWTMSCMKDGIYIAEGNTAITKKGRHGTFSYENAADILKRLVSDGMYAEQQIIDEAQYVVLCEIANDIYWALRDIQGDISDVDTELIDIIHSRLPYDSIIDNLAEYIRRIGYSPIQKCVNIIHAHQGGFRSEIAYRHLRKAGTMAGHLAKPVQIPDTSPLFDDTVPEFFITDEDMKGNARKGSHFAHGKYRIYSYMTNGHKKEEEIAFLKKEYGNGGGTSGICGWEDSYEDHDPVKGITLRKGDGRWYERLFREKQAKKNSVSSAELPERKEIEMNIPWREMQQLISALIDENDYLTKEEVDGLENYEKSTIAELAARLFRYIDDEHIPGPLLQAVKGKTFADREEAATRAIADIYMGDESKEKKLLSVMEELFPLIPEGACTDRKNAKYGIDGFRDYITKEKAMFPKKDMLFKKPVKKKEECEQLSLFDFSKMFEEGNGKAEQMSIFDFPNVL